MQATVLDCFLTRCKAGISIDINKAIMAITTRSSISVNAFRLVIAKPLLTFPVLPNYQDAVKCPSVPQIFPDLMALLPRKTKPLNASSAAIQLAGVYQEAPYKYLLFVLTSFTILSQGLYSVKNANPYYSTFFEGCGWKYLIPVGL